MSVMSKIVAPSPPNCCGIWTPRSFCWRAASCTRCVKTQETTPLEPGAVDHKFYAPGIGHVLTIDLITGTRLELVQIKTE